MAERKLTEDTSKMEDELSTLIEKAKAIKKRYEATSAEFNAIKEDIREFMIDSGINEYAGVEIRRGFSFDIGQFKLNCPKLAQIYVETETKTVVTDKMPAKNKKIIQEKYPEIYKRFIIENTPQVRGL